MFSHLVAVPETLLALRNVILQQLLVMVVNTIISVNTAFHFIGKEAKTQARCYQELFIFWKSFLSVLFMLVHYYLPSSPELDYMTHRGPFQSRLL